VRPVPIYVASYNTRDYTELCVRSLHRYADAPFELVVGDSDSRDGSRELLDELEGEGWLRVERATTRRTHAEWLDRWLAEAPGRHVVFCDSDVQFLGAFLRDMLRVAERTGAAITSPALHPGGAHHNPALLTHLMPRPCPWLMMVDAPRLRTLKTSYEVVTEPSAAHPQGQRTFDVGALLYHRALAAGMSHASMGPRFRRSYRHYANASWGTVKPVGRIRRRSPEQVLQRALTSLRAGQRRPSKLAVVSSSQVG
jgi:glycosyltransferase involved in cell wall biosynthesis